MEIYATKIGEHEIHVLVEDGGNKKYLIGGQVAKVVDKEAFNMYRSMRTKGIKPKLANPHQAQFLLDQGLVKRVCHRTTLLPIHQALPWITGCPQIIN